MTALAEPANLFDPDTYRIDGLERKTSKLRAVLSIEYEPGTTLAEWVEQLRLGQRFAAQVSGRVQTISAGHVISEDDEGANKLTVLAIDTLFPTQPR